MSTDISDNKPADKPTGNSDVDPLLSKEAFANAFNDVIGGGPAKRMDRMRAKAAVLREVSRHPKVLK